MKTMTQTGTAIHGGSNRGVEDYAAATQRRNDPALEAEVGGEDMDPWDDFQDECNLHIAAHDLARWCRPAAEQGDLAARHTLAMLYLLGFIPGGMPADGIPLLRYCAAKGHAPSLVALGWCHELGACVRKEPERAYRLYQHAAEQGNVDALLALESYCAIRGIRQEAKCWKKKAAEALANMPEMDVLMVDLYTEYEQ